MSKTLVNLATLLLPLVTFLSACSDLETPACQQSYSKRGDSVAISELVEEFRATVARVRDEGNLILLSEARDVSRSQNLVAMEDWICRARKLYGT